VPVRPPSRAGSLPHLICVVHKTNVGASLLAKNDDAVFDQNSNVLDNRICRESPIDTKNRLAAEV
jgi:hypothetical protein